MCYDTLLESENTILKVPGKWYLLVNNIIKTPLGCKYKRWSNCTLYSYYEHIWSNHTRVQGKVIVLKYITQVIVLTITCPNFFFT